MVIVTLVCRSSTAHLLRPCSPFLPRSATMSTSRSSFNFDQVFSAANKERTVARLLNKESTSRIENFVNKNVSRKAAVLVPLCYDTTGRPALLYNLRSKNMKKHKGQISFPGGAVDPEDNNDLVLTALRETEEELGISRDKVEIWATLPFVPTATSLVRVAPVLGLIRDRVDAAHLNIHLGEVEFAFTVPLEHLCNPNNWDTTNWAGFILPCFKNLEEFMGDECVDLWGLTAVITDIVLMELVPHAYKRDVENLDRRLTDKPKL